MGDVGVVYVGMVFYNWRRSVDLFGLLCVNFLVMYFRYPIGVPASVCTLPVGLPHGVLGVAVVVKVEARCFFRGSWYIDRPSCVFQEATPAWF